MVILITNMTCNKHCNYCFQKDLDKNEFISKENFVKFIAWTLQNNIKNIGLSGGEFTLHPNIKTILSVLKSKGYYVNLLTNLIFPSQLIDHITKENFKLVINFNQPEEYTSDELNVFEKNLKQIVSKKITFEIRYNIRDKNQNFEHIINYAKQYHPNAIRIDLVRPNLNQTNDFVSMKEIFEYKQIIIDIFTVAKKEGITVFLDCPLPKCYFSDIEIKEYDLYNLGLKTSSCFTDTNDSSQHSLIKNMFVNPDLSIGLCPILRTDKKITDFKDTIELEEFLTNIPEIKTLKEKNYLMKECQECEYKHNNECIGFCLAEKHKGLLKKVE